MSPLPEQFSRQSWSTIRKPSGLDLSLHWQNTFLCSLLSSDLIPRVGTSLISFRHLLEQHGRYTLQRIHLNRVLPLYPADVLQLENPGPSLGNAYFRRVDNGYERALIR